MFLIECIKTFKFWNITDRIGPDIPSTHWRLYLKSTMYKLCKSKFLRFENTTEFRAGAYAICCSKISLGNRVIIRPGTMLFADPRSGGAGITIEDNAMLGSAVHIYVHNHLFDNTDLPIIDQGSSVSKPVLIRHGAWVGAGAIILPGVTIGQNAVVGAGSVVTKNVAPFTVVAGNPAKLLRTLKQE